MLVHACARPSAGLWKRLVATSGIMRGFCAGSSMAHDAQWQHYASLSGNWDGVWTRHTVHSDSTFKLTQKFRGTCAAALAPDGMSVEHTNFYEPGYEPKTGLASQLDNGMYKVNFGTFDATNFRHPFGQHSLAIYSTLCAGIGPRYLKAGTVAVELIIASPDDQTSGPQQRRRLVAMWQKEAAVHDEARLTSITAIAEVKGKGELKEVNYFDKEPEFVTPLQNFHAESRSWHSNQTTTDINGRSEVSHGATMRDWGPPDFIMLGSIAAWLPRKVSTNSSGAFHASMGWQHSAHKVSRIHLSFEQGELASLGLEELSLK